MGEWLWYVDIGKFLYHVEITSDVGSSQIAYSVPSRFHPPPCPNFCQLSLPYSSLCFPRAMVGG